MKYLFEQRGNFLKIMPMMFLIFNFIFLPYKPKYQISVSRFDFHGRDYILCSHMNNFQKSYVELMYKFKFLSWYEWKEKEVRTNIGLADTLIPSSFIYLIYMGGTGPCDSIKIIFGYHVNS